MPASRPIGCAARSAQDAPGKAAFLSRVCLWAGGPPNYSNISTVRATSPAFIARNASFTSSSLPRRDDHVVEVEPPLQVEIDVPRHVDAEAIRAHQRALDSPLGEQLGAVDFDLLPHRDHPDDGRGAARRERVEALLGGLLEPDRLERVIDAAVGQLLDRLDRIGRRRIDRMGRAEPLGQSRAYARTCRPR